ncbi:MULTISPECIES: hypothetical protein [unclassified Streptococcus]|uniref:hypothetical protein n=1 Tax=unclassified Streptococcus TaxID=2608887 RepID=UPI00142FF04D|nr:MULTISPECIES: hypothetical protein [unclassified Streptococcus]
MAPIAPRTQVTTKLGSFIENARYRNDCLATLFIRGRCFERTSVVAGLVAHEMIAPMIYKDSMTSAFL